MMHTILRSRMRPDFKSDSVCGDAGALKARFGDEFRQFAFTMAAPPQPPVLRAPEYPCISKLYPAGFISPRAVRTASAGGAETARRLRELIVGFGSWS